jgi:hypothetical protein
VIEEETTASTARFDFGALREAIESRQAEALIGFYAEDSELRIVNAASPEGPAFELRGISQIGRYLRAVCDQEMTCRVEGEVVTGEGSIAFCEVCEYPEGALISVDTTLEVSEGKIVRQVDVARSARGDDRSER